MAEVPGSTASPPPHLDAPWINSPVLFTTGPLRGKWIRAELVVQQQPRRGRKGAIHDLRPLHPPPTVRLRLYEVQYPVPRYTVIPGSVPEMIQYIDPAIVPPPDAPRIQLQVTAALTTHFLCFASLFKVLPPTREQEYGRVDRKITVGSAEAPSTSATSPLSPFSPQAPPGDIVERPKSDRSRAWKFIRPHPMTAISCRDPQWNLAVSEAWSRLQQDGAPTANPLTSIESGPEDVKGIESIDGDLSFAEMAILEPYLPREPPKWMHPPCDVTAHLSKRETAGHLIPAIENKEPALYFVFSDLAIRNEGYFSLRFHVINLNWHVHPQFTRSGPGFFSPLATCVTNTFAVYSTKEFPGLPPVTEFTSHLVQHGVRIRFRDDRALDTAMREGKSRGDGKARSTRKQSAKPSPDISNEDMEEMHLW